MSDDMTRRQLLATSFGALAVAVLQACSSSTTSPVSSGGVTTTGATSTLASTVPSAPPATSAVTLPVTSFVELGADNPSMLLANMVQSVAAGQGQPMAGITELMTIFAPMPDALDAAMEVLHAKKVFPLTPEELILIGRSHVVPGVYLAADLAAAAGTTLTSFGEVPLTVGASGSSITVNGASVVEADLTFEGGVVHLIDQVLIPDTLRASDTPTTPSGLLSALVEVADARLAAAAFVHPALSGMLAMPDATMFAPSDDAVLVWLAQLDASGRVPNGAGDLIESATQHVVLGTFTAADLAAQNGRVLQTIGGGTVTVEVSGDVVRVGGARVVSSVQADGGAIHVIDAVLGTGS